ncbi:MAG: MG321/MPN456 family lipoprotein [Mycoplasmoidaceae bacterium]
MRLKKIMINSLVLILVSSPFIALTFLNIFPKPDSVDSRYIIDDEITKEQKGVLKSALDETIADEKLIFKFYTLTQTTQYTPSMLSWFVEFDKALNALDSRLGFELIPRTNQTVDSGFRNKNAEMVSMFWSPDYHNIGTWVGLHFAPNYQTANLWPSLYKYLTSGKNGNIPEDSEEYGPLNSIFMVSNWGSSLKAHLENSFYPINPISGVTPENLFQSIDDLIALDRKVVAADPKASKTGARSALSNAITLWADLNSVDTKQPLAAGLVNWMDHQSSGLPWIANGPSTVVRHLTRQGYKTPTNEFSGLNFRDWHYIDGQTSNNGELFRWWTPQDPFATNRTPYNPAFNADSNNMFFQSVFNGLVDWKIVGDWTFGENQHGEDVWTPPKHSFFMSGASKIEFFNNANINNYVLERDKLENNEIIINEQYKQALTTSNRIKFTIEPNFPWLNHRGEEVSKLKAQDYFWALMGYVLSVDLGINTNGYYLDLMNIDVQKTIEANPSFWVKDAKGNYIPKLSDFNTVEFVLTSPNINFLDILSKQYFQPIPIENDKVKAIFDIPSNDSLFNDKGEFIPNNIDFNTLYGAGEKRGNYTSWWSAGPYYVKNVSEQDIEFSINEKYFEVLNSNNNPLTEHPFGSNPKIKNVVMKYAGAYSQQVTYEQFKTGEIDKSDIPSALISEAFNNFKTSFRTEGVSINSRSDLIPYNTNIYIVDDFLEPILDSKGNKQIKSLVSPQYEKAIVADFNEGQEGNSWKIRNAINQCIDWYSLSALALPDNSASFQQSLVPFGNFRSSDNLPLTNIGDPINGFIDKNTYWETAANNGKIGYLRRTLDTYKENWIKQFQKK